MGKWVWIPWKNVKDTGLYPVWNPSKIFVSAGRGGRRIWQPGSNGCIDDKWCRASDYDGITAQICKWCHFNWIYRVWKKCVFKRWRKRGEKHWSGSGLSLGRGVWKQQSPIESGKPKCTLFHLWFYRIWKIKYDLQNDRWADKTGESCEISGGRTGKRRV